jgi:hypothetical protein
VQHTAPPVQSAASSHTAVTPVEQLPLSAMHDPPPSVATQHCIDEELHVVLPHVTIPGVLGAPPSGTGVAVPPLLELAPPSLPSTTPPSPPPLELASCPPLPPVPLASESSPPPLELWPTAPLLSPPPLLVDAPPPSPPATLLPAPPEQWVNASGATDASAVTQARKAWVVLMEILLFARPAATSPQKP